MLCCFGLKANDNGRQHTTFPVEEQASPGTETSDQDIHTTPNFIKEPDLQVFLPEASGLSVLHTGNRTGQSRSIDDGPGSDNLPSRPVFCGLLQAADLTSSLKQLHHRESDNAAAAGSHALSFVSTLEPFAEARYIEAFWRAS